MDSKWEHSGFMTACKRPPSEYFRRQCWVGCDVDESMIPTGCRALGIGQVLLVHRFPPF